MDTNESIFSTLKEKIAEGISEKIEGRGFMPPWPCLAFGMGEPKVPDELIMEDSEM